MAISYTITQSGSTVSYTVNPGVGPKGDTGATGATGDAGPNEVTTTTSTDITGIIKGNGSTVSAAVAGTDYAPASHTHVSSAITDATDDGSTNQGKILKTDASGQVKASGIYADLTGGIGLMAGDPDVAVGNFAIFTGNNITGQRSLYCPNATGTLALTAQTDGSIRATDIDFANTTDIGADLADADEILVADGGGNTARRKSALPRVWTYIKAKIESIATDILVGNYTESVVAIGNTGTAQTISLASGTVQTATLTGNCTFTMPTATAGKSFVLYLNTGAGSFTGAFTGVKWPGGTAPTVTTTASRLDIFSFVADGSNWYGTAIQNFTP